MNPDKALRCPVAICVAALLSAEASASANIAVVIDAPYRVPDRYVSTSVGATPNAAVAVWWEKYKNYWGVQPYGDRQCDYAIGVGSEGVLGRFGRVRLTGECTGSDPIESTLDCPAGYARTGDICQPDGEAIVEKTSSSPCNSTQHPVTFTTGNKFLQVTDLVDWNGRGRAFRRAWNSYNARWHFSYRQRLIEVQTSIHTVSIYEDSGRVVRFNNIEGQWLADVDVRASLTREGEAWLYTAPDGLRQWFDSTGRLLRIAYPGGQRVALTYVGAEQVEIRDAYDNLLVLTLDADNRVVTMRDPDGQTYRYGYDSAGQLQYVAYPDNTPDTSGSNPFGEDNPVLEYHYEDPRHPMLVTGVTDQNGQRHKTVAYDADGRAVASGLGAGDIDGSALDYSNFGDALDPRVAVTNALGKDTVYHLQSFQGVNRVSRIEGIASADCLADTRERDHYPDTGWLRRSVDKAGNTSFHDYYTDPQRYGLPRLRVEGEATALERRYTFDWEPGTRRLARETLEGISQTEYAYDPEGRLLSRTVTDLTAYTEPYASQGQRRHWTYDYSFHDAAELRVAELVIDGPRTDVADNTRYEYAPSGFLLLITNPAGHVTRYFDHNGRGQPGRRVDGNGVETRYQWSSRGWLLSSEIENGAVDAVTRYSYDPAGNLTTAYLPSGNQFNYTYDAAHHLEQVVDGVGNRMSYQRDAAGNVVLETIADNAGLVARSVEYGYDELSRLRTAASPAFSQRTMGYAYSATDNPDQFRLGGNPASAIVYDSLGRQAEVTHPDGYRSRYEYNANDSVSRVIDQRGLATTYQYDGLGNLMRQVSPDSGVVDYHYDSAGNRVSALDAEGRRASYAYDALNRLTGIGFDDRRLDIHFDYDDTGLGDYQLGRLSRVRDSSGSQARIYDGLGHLAGIASVIGMQAFSWLYEYNPDGTLASIVYPGGRRVNYARNGLGQVTDVVTAADLGEPEEVVMSNARYLPFGPLQSFDYGNGLRRELAFDASYAMKKLHVVGLSSPMEWDYAISNEGTISSISDAADAARSQQFHYDAQNRLLGAASTALGKLEFEYDGVGSRVSKWLDLDGDQQPDQEVGYLYDGGSNRLSSVSVAGGGDFSMAHDRTGNLLADGRNDRLFTYDATGRLASVVSASAGIDAVYNGLGQRVIKTSSDGETIHFHYGPQGELLLETLGDGSPLREYIYLHGQALAVVAEDTNRESGDGDSDGVADEADNCPEVSNPNQTDADGDGVGNACDTEQVVSYSLAAEDGWLRESREGSGIGGRLNAGSGRGIRVGDDKKNRQYKSILSFQLAELPEGAQIRSATLALKRKSRFVVGEPGTLGPVTLDLHFGAFSGDRLLQLSDFDAPADVASAGQLQDGDIADVDFGELVLGLLQSALTQGARLLQLRLQASSAADGDDSNDYVYYYSGEQGDDARRPRLTLEYRLADQAN